MTPKKSSIKATHDHWSRTGIEKFGIDQGAVGLEDGQPEHDESPEGEEVCQPWDGPLQQFPLSEDLNRLGFDDLAWVWEAPLGPRLSGTEETQQREDPTTSHCEGEQREEQSESERWAHERPPGRRSVGGRPVSPVSARCRKPSDPARIALAGCWRTAAW